MRELFQVAATERESDEFKEKVLRNLAIPNGAGLTYGELYDDAASNNELEPGETFLRFVERVKAAQGEADGREPIDDYHKAA